MTTRSPDATAETETLLTRSEIRVASVPADHVYVRHLSPPDPARPDAVHRLPDPVAPGAPATTPWWPPRMLDAAWIAEHVDEFDVFHVHFGFDAISVDALRAIVEALRAAAKPLVYTVHDLRNPHQEDRSIHDRHLDVLIASADAVITLTPGAAAEISARWNREAIVLPHPHVVDFATMARLQARHRSGPPRIGVHVKSRRANMNPLEVVSALVEGRDRLPPAVIQVDGHPDLLEPTGARFDRELSERLHGYATDGLIDLRVHDYFCDDDLWEYLASLTVSVLPYRFGTHSGWLEACRDLGTAVVAPSCGYYADQGARHVYRNDDLGFEPRSLEHGVRAALEEGTAAPVPVAARRRQREELARRHTEIYRSVLP